MKLLCLMFLIIAAVADIRTKKISMVWIACTAFLSVVSAAVALTDRTGTIRGILAAMLPGAGLVLLSVLSRQSVGAGDGLLLAATGPVFGWRLALTGLMTAFFLSAIVSAVLLISGKAGRKTRIPFVPFLASAMGVMTIAIH
ncbi:MAG: prepilin peptidase [Lachnospiraceae bacterium]|nr:prepilin peptidase [Lachnospiraceae bacterium]